MWNCWFVLFESPSPYKLTHLFLDTLIEAIRKRGVESLNTLTVVSNNGGTASGGGLSPLVETGQISRLIMSFLGNNKSLEKKYLSGEVAIELTPQGTIAERLRAAGAGIPAFYTPTGVSKLNFLLAYDLISV